jgi:hypothetical protein
VQAESPASSLRDTPAQHRRLFRFVETWQTVLGSLVPVGYEDETGFHYGEKTKAGWN